MPPCSCIAFPATSTAAPQAYDLAIDAATVISGSWPGPGTASCSTASVTSWRATQFWTSMSAQACLTAWNEPMGRPNCSRTCA